MGKLIFIIVLFFAASVSAQEEAWMNKYSSQWANYKGGTKLLVTNNNLLPITYKLNYKPTNMTQSVSNGTYIVIPSMTENFEVVDFKILNKAKSWKVDGGEVIKGNWVRVKTLFHNYEKIDGRIGYVFDGFLSKHLNKIPENSLHNFTRIYDRKQKKDIEVEGVSERKNLYELGQDCDVRYEYNPAAKKVLKDIVQFSIIDINDFEDLILPATYQLDASFIPRRFPLENETAAREGYTQYYLPIDSGRDSTLIKDDSGEWASITEYLGYIEKLDSYFITGFAEDQEIVQIDQKTGKRMLFANGNFSISPAGKFLISAYSEIFDQLSAFIVRPLENLESGYEINFTSWMPVGEISWVSEHKFIMPVVPMDHRYTNIKDQKPIHILGEIKI